ncbi:MAG: DUF1501 domain-containing protein [Gammaproteobacteria bacterium]|nr:DUF1501 domain-containing protein [Gammaproteobacteria bacterium]
MKRRTLLKGLLGTGVAVGSCVFRNPLISTAQAATIPTLIVVFQRGGCDGLNTVVPFGDSDYYNLRPTIAIPEPGNGPLSAINLNGFFGLHPSLTALMPIYNAGQLAVFPAVQYPDASRSHFDGQQFIESGASQRDISGWLNRHLQIRGVNSNLQAVSFGSELAQALRGSVPVQSFSSIDSFTLGLAEQDETALINTVMPVYGQSPTPATDYRRLVHQYGNVLFNNLDTVANIDTSSYQPENGAMYPGGSYGRSLRETAQLIKMNVGLELVTINIGGWDTHSNQGNGDPGARQSRRLREFADGLSALRQDLGTAGMDNVIILSMTEFGRTCKENGSRGTDHGHASSWFMFGPNVNGGIHGTWPGLTEADMVRGRYLQHSVNYRDIMGDIMVNHFGHSSASLGSLLPGHQYSSLGLIS